jgi:hypothetical protein
MLAWCLLVATDAIVLWGGAPALLKIIRAYPVRRFRASGGPGAEDLLEAMRRASILSIHHYKCLKYWAAVTCLLRFYGHPASFVIGVTRQPFQSHAWLEYEGGSAGRDQIPGAQWLVVFRG